MHTFTAFTALSHWLIKMQSALLVFFTSKRTVLSCVLRELFRTCLKKQSPALLGTPFFELLVTKANKLIFKIMLVSCYGFLTLHGFMCGRRNLHPLGHPEPG